MIIIGITGSIGMGKSTIASMLKFFYIPIFDADHEVNKIIENNVLVKEEIKKRWPDVIFINKSQEFVSKSKLGDLIFKNRRYKARLEKIIHPLIHKKREQFLYKYKDKKNIIAMDVPLLYETNINKMCDYVFLALTSEKKQRCRVLRRPNMNRKKFFLIKNSQWSDKKKKTQNPYIISTSYGKFCTFILISIFLTNIIIKEKVLKR